MQDLYALKEGEDLTITYPDNEHFSQIWLRIPTNDDHNIRFVVSTMSLEAIDTAEIFLPSRTEDPRKNMIFHIGLMCDKLGIADLEDVSMGVFLGRVENDIENERGTR